MCQVHTSAALRASTSTRTVAAAGACATRLPTVALAASTGGAGGLGAAAPAQHSFARRQQVAQPHGGSGGCSTGGGSCTPRGAVLYEAALNYARAEQFERAQRVFSKTVQECPSLVKAWVSWAQMEKRRIPKGDAARWVACREVLQRGLVENKDAPALLQAWGLLEMQRGNWVAAVLLLDRSARLEPRNLPVLRWKPVIEARKTVGQRRRGRGDS